MLAPTAMPESCADSPKLRNEVEGLLRAFASAGSFLEAPAGEKHPDLLTRCG